jgi:hypothetical protein
MTPTRTAQVYSGPKVKAVVVSSCNIHAHNCGTDLIRKTWDLATTGATPGEADCTVSRTSTNPMTGGKSPKESVLCNFVKTND